MLSLPPSTFSLNYSIEHRYADTVYDEYGDESIHYRQHIIFNGCFMSLQRAVAYIAAIAQKNKLTMRPHNQFRLSVENNLIAALSFNCKTEFSKESNEELFLPDIQPWSLSVIPPQNAEDVKKTYEKLIQKAQNITISESYISSIPLRNEAISCLNTPTCTNTMLPWYYATKELVEAHTLDALAAMSLVPPHNRMNHLTGEAIKLAHAEGSLMYFKAMRDGGFFILDAQKHENANHQLENDTGRVIFPYQPHSNLVSELTDSVTSKAKEIGIGLSVYAFDNYEKNSQIKLP